MYGILKYSLGFESLEFETPISNFKALRVSLTVTRAWLGAPRWTGNMGNVGEKWASYRVSQNT